MRIQIKKTGNNIILFILFLSFTSSAQLKVFQNGSISYGSTTAPAYGEKHHFSGNSIFSASPVLPSINGSSAFIRGNDNYSGATTPDYSWQGNDQTGIFHPSANTIGLSIGGIEKLKIDNTNLNISGNTKITGTVRFDNWSDILIDWTSGFCCSTPVIYPENDWYMQLGTPTNWIGLGYISHVVCKQAISIVSDEKFKQNINYDMSDACKKLLKLKPASYNLKPDLFKGAPADEVAKICNKKQFGLIAQEVLEIFPELVDKDVINGSYSLSYMELIPLLIETAKIQNNHLDSLQTQLINLQNTLSQSKIANNSSLNSGTQNNSSYLKQNNSHSFNTKSTIEYFIKDGNSSPSVLIFDLSGKLLKTFKINGSGNGSLAINGGELHAGMYYYTLLVNNTEMDTKKMILTE